MLYKDVCIISTTLDIEHNRKFSKLCKNQEYNVRQNKKWIEREIESERHKSTKKQYCLWNCFFCNMVSNFLYIF